MENNTTRENPQTQPARANELDRLNTIKHLIDEIEYRINNAQKIPLTGTSIISGGALLDLTGRIRTELVGAFSQAEGIVAQEGRILSEARAKADHIANQAEMEVEKANEARARILKEAEDERSAVLERAQAEYDEKIALALNRENIVKQAREEVDRCAVKGEEIVLDAQKQAEQIIKDAHESAQQILAEGQRRADALYNQASSQADKAVSGAVAAINAYSIAFDNDAGKIVDTLQNVKVLVDLLNESGERLGGFAQDMAQRRDRLLHPEYFEE